MKAGNLMIAVGAVVLIRFSALAEEPGPKQTLHVGVLVPLTGGPAEQGRWALEGAELGQSAVAADGVEVVLHVEDTQADPKLALSAFNALRAKGQLDAVVTYGSGVGIALSSLANQHKVIQMGIATAAPSYRSADDFTFRNFPSAELEAQYLVGQALNTLKVKSAAIVRINNEYGLGTASAFKTAFEKAGGAVVAEETLEPAAGDYRSIVTRLRSHQADFLYLAAYPNEGALFLRQARELGLHTPALASVAIIGAKNFFELAGQGAEGMLVASSTPVFVNHSAPPLKSFVESYRRKLGTEPSMEQMYAARSYDAVRVLAAAKSHCADAAPECLRDGLFQTKNFEGPSGSISFDRNGDVTNEFSLLRLSGGKFELVN